MSAWKPCGPQGKHPYRTKAIAMRLLGHTTIGMTMRVYRRGVEHVKALAL